MSTISPVPLDEALWRRLKGDCDALVGRPAEVPRFARSAENRRARDWLVSRLAEIGVPPAFGDAHAIPYRDGFANVVARVIGTCHSAEVAAPRRATLLIGAHFDSCRNTPGADDNAAAVAIVLEVAMRLHAAPPQTDVVIALFDAEEPPNFLTPNMGSTRLFEDVLATSGERFIPVVLDLCGHDLEVEGLEHALAIVGLESDAGLRAVFDEVAGADDTLLPLPVPNVALGGDFSDYHAFNVRALPYVFLSCGEWTHYHLPTDTLDRLSAAKTTAVARFLERFVRAVAANDAVGHPATDPHAAAWPGAGTLDHGERDARDLARFERHAAWFGARTAPALAAAGMSSTGNVARDLYALRMLLRG